MHRTGDVVGILIKDDAIGYQFKLTSREISEVKLGKEKLEELGRFAAV